ncbi:MAG: hypothetical protein IT258_07015 [Saprospiraceae bacterium]|nr:hypothetical protein [Saprospiraceae bacterium]
MKIKQLTFATILVLVLAAFFAFYVPGEKVSASSTWGRTEKEGCGMSGSLLCSPNSKPIEHEGKQIFNSKMYLNKKGILVIEYDKEYIVDSTLIYQFSHGYFDIKREFLVDDAELLSKIGSTQKKILVKTGRYPVRKGWGKYIVTFEQSVGTDVQEGEQ